MFLEGNTRGSQQEGGKLTKQVTTNNIGLPDVAALINKYIPESIIAIIDKYTATIPILNGILRWAFVIIMMIFLSYIVKIFINKKKL